MEIHKKISTNNTGKHHQTTQLGKKQQGVIKCSKLGDEQFYKEDNQIVNSVYGINQNVINVSINKQQRLNQDDKPDKNKIQYDKTKEQLSSKNYQNQHNKTQNVQTNNHKNKYHKKYRRKVELSGQSDQENGSFRFPFVNYYLDKHSEEHLATMNAIDQARKNTKGVTSFINCDVRYFNWSMFVQSIGKFDVMIIDPPWRIKGAQQNDSQFMFSNCKFSLDYNTMANSQIARIPLHMLIDQGFIFLWILNSQLNSSLQIMQNWGFQLIDELIWVKLRDEKVNMTHGYYFMHSYQMCLVGYKSNHVKPCTLKKYISSNVLFAEVQKKSQKPSDLYYIIEMMFQGKKKIQIFARNHNLRFGIFSIGNELGESYDKWKVTIQCDHCQKPISIGNKRYKSKHQANYDVCEQCAQNLQKQQFFELSNAVDEDIRHEYVRCNGCGAQPIWGIWFQCITCCDFDLCQCCFDRNLMLEDNSKLHPIEHQFRTNQVPVFGNGFHIHQFKCASCYQNPIIGICYNCLNCKNYKLCQKCFFDKPKTQLAANSRSHKQNHQMQAIFEPQLLKNKKYECFECKKQIFKDCWMCQNCYNFFFCQQCYEKRDSFKSFYANSHKKYHIYTHIF